MRTERVALSVHRGRQGEGTGDGWTRTERGRTGWRGGAASSMRSRRTRWRTRKRRRWRRGSDGRGNLKPDQLIGRNEKSRVVGLRGWRCRRRERAGATAHRRWEGDGVAEEGGGGGDEERGPGGREGCRLARGIGARRVEGARQDGGQAGGREGERNGEETAAREAGRWDCRALF